MDIIRNPGWRSALGGFLIHLVLGTLYLWGIITVPVTSYIRKFDPSVTYDDTIMVYGAALGMQGATYILGGVIAKKYSYRISCFIGGYILVLGCFIAAFVQSLLGLILTYGLMFGVGLGFCYTPPLGASTSWLPHRKGILTGIIVAGFGGGAFVFSFITSSCLSIGTNIHANENKLVDGYFPPDSPVVNNVPTMFGVLAVCYFVLITIGTFLLMEPPNSSMTLSLSHSTSSPLTSTIIPMESSHTYQSHSRDHDHDTKLKSTSHSPRHIEYEGLKDEDSEEYDLDRAESSNHMKTIPTRIHSTTHYPTTSSSSSSSSHHSKPTHIIGQDLDTMGLIRDPLCWHVASCFVTTTIGGMYLLGTFKVFGQAALGPEFESMLSVVGGTAALFNAGGRIIWGALGDRIGPIETLIIMSIAFSIIIFTYPLSPSLGGIDGFTTWTFLIFLCEGGNFALYMPVIIQLFGSLNSSANFAVIATVFAISNVLNIAYLSVQKVSFEVASTSMGILTFVGFINVCLLRYHVSRRVKYSYQTYRCE